MRTFIALLIGLLALPSLVWGLEPELQAAEAKEAGIQDFNLTRYFNAMENLEISAEAGDVESMYYLGESHYRAHISYTTEAVEWYARAARQGDPYAMLRLYQAMACELGDREQWCPEGDDDWDDAIEAQERPKAEAGDSEAMLIMHYLTYINSESRQAQHWLEQAAEAGNPEAQNLMGYNIRWEDQGWYWTESRRLEAAEEWFRKATEQNHVPAMYNLMDLLVNKGKEQEAWSWVIKASDLGHLDARLTLAACYIEPRENELCQVNNDIIEGWAILETMNEEAPDHTTIERAMRLREDLVTEQQREEAKILAKKEWIDNEPSLSRHTGKYNP